MTWSRGNSRIAVFSSLDGEEEVAHDGNNATVLCTIDIAGSGC